MATQRERLVSARNGVMIGVVGGLLGAGVMAMYAMVVSATVKDVGFFTPLYHIASSVISPKAMMTSMETASGGNSAYFTAGPALVGLVVHMLIGASAGGLFGAAAAFAALSRSLTIVGGVIFGLFVMVANALVGLPIVANLFGGGKAISDMPAMVGWGTFTIEHVLFGLVLGAVVAGRHEQLVDVADRPLAERRA